eukprot:6139616-Pyramimonas_sp.AAC.1
MKLSTSVPVKETFHMVASASAFDAEVAVNYLAGAAEEQDYDDVYAYFAACTKAEGPTGLGSRGAGSPRQRELRRPSVDWRESVARAPGG